MCDSASNTTCGSGGDSASFTDGVIKFYDDMSKKVNFVSRVNTEDLTPEANDIVSKISPEIMKRYYGSGFLVPEVLKGARILDLGSGAGSSVFLLSKLVGPTGYVVGVDLSEELLEKAKEESEYHWKKWGYDKANFEFIKQNIEEVDQVLPKESFDIVLSNGVLGLCENQDKIIGQAFEMLKPNGMFLLGDSFAEFGQSEDKAKATKFQACQCLARLLRWYELSPIATSKGFTTPYIITCGTIGFSPESKAVLDNNYVCAEVRLFKLAPGTEQKGNSSVTYKGTIPNYEESLPFGVTLVFKTGESVNIDGELATHLANSDFSEHFNFGEATGEPENKRNENPFHVLKERGNDNAPPHRYIS